MATRYEVRVKDTDGLIVARLADNSIRRLEYTKRVNAPGQYSLRMDGDSPNVNLFQMDGMIEVWRSDLAASPQIPWYLDFEGFHRIESRETRDSGLSVFVSQGPGYANLLNRRNIQFQPTSTGADKSGAGETVIKEYADENVGPGAVAPPRLFNGVTSGLSIQANGAAGSSWEGSRAYRNLLDVLQEIGDATGVDFEVVGTGPAAYQFNAKAKPLGADRTTVGLVPATGLNGAGNAPVIFALGFGNMGNPVYTLNRMAEVTAVSVLGQGKDTDRIVVQRVSAATTDTPWNVIESVANANQEEETAALNAVGDARLDKLQARETFTFEVVQTEASRLGREYFHGDQVTARYQAIERNKQIIGVTIAIQEGSEDIAIELGDVT